MKNLFFAVALMIPMNAAIAQDVVGIATLTIPAAHQGHDIKMAVMYPAKGGTETLLGENAVFFGTAVREDAKALPGKRPLILFSHGWGGNYVRMGWLTAGLASKGAIVVSVNHPNSTTRDIQYQSALNHWTRVQDLSAALDYVLKDPALSATIDPARISVVGYSYGGWTALSMAGLKGERDGFEQYCKAAGDGSQFCSELKNAGAEIDALDREKYEASYKDNRIVSVVAIEPGLTWGLTANDVAALDVPLMLIGLGQGKDRLEATDTSETGSNFEGLVPSAQVENISPAMHFTALGVCKPAGEAILLDEKDDPVCTDPAGTDRKSVLNKIIELVARHFKLG